MNTLAMDLESFDYELDLNDKTHKPGGKCSCVQCQKNKASDSINQSQQAFLELDNLFDDELEAEIDFVSDPELEIEQERKRRIGRRPRRSAPRSSTRFRKAPRRKSRPQRLGKALRPRRPRRRHIHGRRPILRSRRRRPVIIREPAAPCICPAHGTEYVRWVQSSLNQVMKLRLRINGVMNRATRDALQDFQKQEGLPIDGIAGPETEKALLGAKTGQSSRSQSATTDSELFDDQTFELEEWELEVRVNRKSRVYIRWLQQSLNKVMDANLVVDGMSGRRTRSAIRSFQKRFSLAVDGIVGAQTEAMLTMLGFSIPPATKIPSVPAIGDWVMPSAVRTTGEAQYVRYDSPLAWAGNPGNCTGSFTAGAKQLKNYILSRHPGVSRIGGYNCRVNSANRSKTSVHGVGRALDIMIPTVSGRANSAVGDPIANWLVQNAKALGVQFLIWNRTKWTGSRNGRKHGRYRPKNPHTDHIHVELNRDGAQRRTAWFQQGDTRVA